MKRNNTETIQDLDNDRELLVSYSYSKKDEGDLSLGVWDVEVERVEQKLWGNWFDITPSLTEEEIKGIIGNLKFG